MSEPQSTEGYIPFAAPNSGKECKTWYKIIGSLSSSNTPVILIHGGPGLSHDYMLSYRVLNEKYGIPLILYDQLGNGKSTHLKEKAGDENFWGEELFLLELENLIQGLGLGGSGKDPLTGREREYDILGQSWGAMLGASFGGQRPKGLRKLILSNGPATMQGWVDAQKENLKTMPEEVRRVLERYEEEGITETKEWEEATDRFNERHMLTVPEPEELKATIRWMKEDSTVCDVMSSNNDFVAAGLTKDWSAVEAAKRIEVPTLILNGVGEGASDEAIKPFLEGIKGVKYVKLRNSTHMPMFEEPDNYFNIIGEFLLE